MSVYIKKAFWKLGTQEPSLLDKEAAWDLASSHRKPRRRLSALGKVAFQGYEALIQSGASEILPWVVSCRHGDTERMVRLLDDLRNNQPLSPIDFSLSTHNALVGMMFVESQNTQTHSAIAAGPESFYQGLLEAYACCQQEQAPCGFLYYDRPIAPSFDSQFMSQEEVCIGLVLSLAFFEKELKTLPLESMPNLSIFLEKNMISGSSDGEKTFRDDFIRYLTEFRG